MAAASVDRALCICTTLEEFDTVHALALRHANLGDRRRAPDSEGVREPTVADLTALGTAARGGHRRDRPRLLPSERAQRRRYGLAAGALPGPHPRALQTGLPLVVHTRSAADDTLAILRRRAATRAGGVFHCFTETLAVARGALELGFYVSFSGILTFRNAAELREVARSMCHSTAA